MKTNIALLTLLLLMPFLGISQTAVPVAVVELFTSEGCHSCPAADELLKTMSEEREKLGKPIVGLAFHVTYWNNLGWVDAYSQEEFTQRQKQYSVVLKQPQYYTPQAVVNGEHEFIGSNAVAFRDTLTKAAWRKPAYVIEAKAINKNDSIEVQYSLNKDSKNFQLNIALVERNSERQIMRGENKNRTLKHFNVVRVFKTVELTENGSVSLPVLADLSPDNMEIVLYVQHKKSWRIAGASKITMQP
jgi:hypothetical protein